MHTYVVTNQKGGVAKTTTAFNLGIGLYKQGYKVLLIDLDAQTNLAFNAGVNLLNIDSTLYDCFKNKADIEDCIINLDKGLDIVIGGIDFAGADREFNQLGREKMLSKALKPISKQYDYCVIDTPTTLGVINENSLTFADTIIIPMKAEVYALQGINQLYGFIEDIRENSNPDIKIGGILLTMVNENTNLYKDMRVQIEKVAERIGTKVYKSYIHNATAVGEVAIQRGNLYDLAPRATATKDYIDFVKEVIKDSKRKAKR